MDENRRILTVSQLEEELARERRQTRRRRRRRIVLWVLLLLLALLLIAGSFFLPILRISGDSMAETLQDGDVIVGLSLSRYVNGDVVAFRYKGGILVKRLLAQGLDWVELDHDGRFFVNGARLEEPYVAAFRRGNCDVVFPLTVPEGSCFVAGDNRADSIDSRSSVVGCIEEDALVGRMLLRVWPLARFGLIR